ncbi:MAG: twin-arginine translocase TatA/TatE family subunit [Bacteroidales bacterium]|nr:twin-arginine translocase TatA/TatE family subunit [Bacteroidales bacterium]
MSKNLFNLASNFIFMVFIGLITSTEWIIILVIVIILFGGKKIPELMRSLGKGVSEFKKGKDDIENDLNTDNKGNDHKDNNPAG